MIEQAFDRDSVSRYVEAVRQVLGSDQLSEATRSAAQQIPGEGQPAAKVNAALPRVSAAEPSSGGAQGGQVPYLSRDPVVSLVQSAIEGSLRGEGAIDEPPVHRNFLERIVHTVEALLHPGNFSPDDPDWVIKIAESVLQHLAEGNHPFNPRPAEHAISDSARLVVVGDWGTGLPRAQAVARYMAQEVAGALDQGRQAHVIHLGDGYYSGLPGAVARNVLAYCPGTPEQAKSGVTSWSLNGNHYMYGGGFRYDGTRLRCPRCGAGGMGGLESPAAWEMGGCRAWRPMRQAARSRGRGNGKCADSWKPAATTGRASASPCLTWTAVASTSGTGMTQVLRSGPK